ncbi:MAG: AGCS family alanine or glycine:cation symporter, partial [Gammaproteobacteria bacterium]
MRDNKVYVSDVWRRGWAARLPDYPHLVNSMSVCARWSALVTMGASPSALAQTSMPTFVDTLACASTSAQMLVVHVVEALEHVLFFNVPFLQVPFIVLWLFTGALFFTVRMRFINVRGFRHAIELVRGKYDDPNEPGEITHFQALSSALAATVGLGNIAGVTIAVTAGGPGAIFWLVVAGLLGMTSKFTECTLAQMYRRIDEDGRVVGGPMVYLSEGLRDKGLPRLGRVLAVGFSLFC